MNLLILTDDVPQVVSRMLDFKNGVKIPFEIGLKQLFDFVFHPIWVLKHSG